MTDSFAVGSARPASDPSSAPSAASAVRASGLGYWYHPGAWAVRGLDLDFSRGAVHAVLGLNGCGKTTLLRMILGVLKPREGTVETSGRIAFVPQLFQAVFSFTALDMVLMGRARQIGLFSRPSRRDEALALKAMERLGVDSLAHRPYPELSGGQRQLVILARALVSGASTLVLDEPASALDLANQALLMGQIKRLARDDGLTVVFSTHLPQHALATADDVLLMTAGGPALAGPTREILTEENLARVYGTDVALVEYERGGERGRALVTIFDN